MTIFNLTVNGTFIIHYLLLLFISVIQMNFICIPQRISQHWATFPTLTLLFPTSIRKSPNESFTEGPESFLQAWFSQSRYRVNLRVAEHTCVHCPWEPVLPSTLVTYTNKGYNIHYILETRFPGKQRRQNCERTRARC